MDVEDTQVSPWTFSVVMQSDEEMNIDLPEILAESDDWRELLEDVFKENQAPVRHWLTTVCYIWQEAKQPIVAIEFAQAGVDFLLSHPSRAQDAVPLLCQLVAYNVALARNAYKFNLATASPSLSIPLANGELHDSFAGNPLVPEATKQDYLTKALQHLAQAQKINRNDILVQEAACELLRLLESGACLDYPSSARFVGIDQV
jgi:hypothetical protein